MAHDPARLPSRLVIRNIGLLLSGDIRQPLLDADTVVAVDGRIIAVGKQKALSCSDCPDNAGAVAGIGEIGKS
jgi:enamidase